MPKGTYYVEIYLSNINYTSTPYEISISFSKNSTAEKEINNSYATANAIDLNAEYKGFSTNLNYNHDIDCYKITLPKNGNVTLYLKNLTGVEWDMDLLDKDGNVYQSVTSDDSELVTGYSYTEVGLPAGTYYIRIESVRKQ